MNVTVYTCNDSCEDNELSTVAYESTGIEHVPVYVPHDCYLYVPTDLAPYDSEGEVYVPVGELRALLDSWVEFMDMMPCEYEPFVLLDGGPNSIHRFMARNGDILYVIDHVFV